MEFHEIANIFPMMTAVEYGELVKSIREYGYDKDDPIVLYEGKILDGRNRYTAAIEVGVEPVYTEFTGNDAIDFVVRRNLTRRHLTVSQKAIASAECANMKVGNPRGWSQVNNTNSVNLPNWDDKTSQTKAAELFGISPSAVAQGKRVLTTGVPELQDAVRTGRASVSAAAQVATLPEPEQKEIVARGEDEIVKEANRIKSQRKKEAQAKRTAERHAIALQAVSLPKDKRWNIYHGDMTNIQLPNRYDFIITDPPYPKEFLPLYEILAMRAKEWLKEGGLLIAMCGQSYFEQIVKSMTAHMDYYWTAAYLTPGQPTPLRQRQVNTTWKPLLILSHGEYKGKIFGDVFTSDGNDKDFHKWGQSVSGMLSVISQICLPGQSILDPFCGAGTTGVAALHHGCLFDGIEIDEVNVGISKTRLTDYDK